jgi:hypothetical protein
VIWWWISQMSPQDGSTGSTKSGLIGKFAGEYTISGDARIKVHRCQSGILTLINQTAKAAITSLSVGNLKWMANGERN